MTALASPHVSTWTVPKWLDPNNGGTGLTYHKPGNWIDGTILRTAARGQEFVADIGDRADAHDWLTQLFEREI